jgi:two-component system response regulator GlrR
LLSEWLAPEGFSLSHAADADSALSVMGIKPIAAVLVDKDMPGHDGTWLIEQIQRRHPSVAMLLATGDATIRPQVSLSTGVIGYLVKPFNRAAVVAAVKEALLWHQTALVKRQQPQEGTASIETWLEGEADR